MATRKPLVVVSGFLSELPPNDTVDGALVGTLTAGSGLSGGGSLSTNQRVDVSLAPNPSGLIFVGNSLGIDGVAQRTADAALARQQVNTAVTLSGGVSGAVVYQSAPNTTSFLSPGISGQYLMTLGSGQAPSWITVNQVSQSLLFFYAGF